MRGRGKKKILTPVYAQTAPYSRFSTLLEGGGPFQGTDAVPAKLNASESNLVFSVKAVLRECGKSNLRARALSAFGSDAGYEVAHKGSLIVRPPRDSGSDSGSDSGGKHGKHGSGHGSGHLGDRFRSYDTGALVGGGVGGTVLLLCCCWGFLYAATRCFEKRGG